MFVFPFILIVGIALTIVVIFFFSSAVFSDSKKAMEDAMSVWLRNRDKAEWARLEPIDDPCQWECSISLSAVVYRFVGFGEEFMSEENRFVSRLSCVTPKGERLLLIG